MKKFLTLATILGLGLYSTESSAQLFKLRTTSYGSVPGAQQAAWDSALSDIEADINKDFPSSNTPNRLMKGMANSTVMAGKGIGSDYASRMEVALLGAGVGIGADMEKDKSTDSDISGVGVQGGVIIGTNLSWMDSEKILGLYTDRLNVYANYLGYNVDRELGDKGDKLNAKLMSFGVHASYDLVLPKGSSLLRWGGVKIHTGYEYNSTKLKFSTSITEEISEDVGGATVTGDLNAKPSAKIDATTHSIPIEASTNVQLLYFLSLYTGIGVDINFGNAKGAGSLGADETELEYNSGGPGSGPTVQAEANVDSSGNANSFLYRAFAGVQINIPFVNIFVQADKAIGTELVAATAGVRFVY